MTGTPEPATAGPFSRIRIRAGALVFCGDDVALIRRDRAGSTHCTPPGGSHETGVIEWIDYREPECSFSLLRITVRASPATSCASGLVCG
ncbi:hypothetical protein [Streptomyces sp. NPDC093071]|uniref:hypothetical protein n=1 Tax=Streptomyces sp. NPDC093071 TaxID=3366022 RepID=UPI0037F76F93